MSLGFVYQCFNEDLSLFNCLSGVREHYPDAPIYLMSDGGGNDYSKIAERFKCKYIKYLDNVDPRFQKNSWDDKPVSRETNIERYLAYLRRMKNALTFLDTDYILRLEDDVRCIGRIWHIPKFDVVGPFNVYGIFDDVTNHYINYTRGTPYSKEKDKVYNYNCGGGAIFKRTSFLEYIEKVLENPDVAYYLYDLNSRNLKDEAIADGLGMLFFGYSMGRSFNIADVNVDIGPLKKYVTIVHHYKEDYGKKCDLERPTTFNSGSKVKDMIKRYESSTTMK